MRIKSLIKVIDWGEMCIAGHSLGGYAAFLASQKVGKHNVKACLTMDADWLPLQQADEDFPFCSQMPLCLIQSFTDMENQGEDHKDIFEKVFLLNENKTKE